MSPPKGQGWNLPKTKEMYLRKRKEDLEKPEVVVLDTSGNKGELRIDADTHSKIVLSNESIKQLISYAKKGDEWAMLGTTSWDDIIQMLLRQCQKKKKSRYD